MLNYEFDVCCSVSMGLLYSLVLFVFAVLRPFIERKRTYVYLLYLEYSQYRIYIYG